MRILITGGTGYIGSHVALVFLENGYEVIIVDNLSNSFHSVISSLENVTDKAPIFEEVDICNTAGLQKVFQQYSPIDAVIHLAGLKSVPESVYKPLSYYENNVMGTENLLRIMQEYGCHFIVFSSSASVYGDVPTEQMPITECQRLNPTNPYGQSKHLAETKIMGVCIENTQFTAVSLRYFNPVGSHSSGLLRENPKKAATNLFPSIQKVLSGEKDCLNVYSGYDTKDGTGVRDYIHVMDLAQSHLYSLSIKTPGYYIYNIGIGTPHSVLEVIANIEQANSVTIPYKLVPRRSGDVNSLYTDPSLANERLKWTPQLSGCMFCL
jgi:UDP-glucose 4-epimerase